MPFVPDSQQAAPSGGRFVPDAPPSPAPKTASVMERLGLGVKDTLKHTAGRATRMGAEAVGAIPLMAADFGVAVRNVGENAMAGRPLLQQTRELPSQMYARGLDQAGLPRPQGAIEKTTDFIGQAVIGSRLPVPQIKNPAPANFVPQAQQAVQAANRAGYTIPPATSNPGSTVASAAEGAAGKLSTGQLAASMNQPVTNRLAAQAVGIADDGTVTREALSAIRAEAGQAHEALRRVPIQIASDTEYRVARAAAVRSMERVAEKFPPLAQKEVLAIANSLDQPRFSPDDVVDAVRLLRDRADVAYRAGDKTLGSAYRGLSDAFEGLIERRLSQSGPEGAGLVQSFRDARQLIAKTYTIENALKGENVDAAALARALNKGAPLSGTLRQIAQFAQRFPKAARMHPATESQPIYSPLDGMAAGASIAAALTTQNPAALIPGFYAAGRPVLRNFLLSPAGQKLAAEGIDPAVLARGAGALPPAINSLRRPEPAPVHR
jgi:hypothetical protein